MTRVISARLSIIASSVAVALSAAPLIANEPPGELTPLNPVPPTAAKPADSAAPRAGESAGNPSTDAAKPSSPAAESGPNDAAAMPNGATAAGASTGPSSSSATHNGAPATGRGAPATRAADSAAGKPASSNPPRAAAGDPDPRRTPSATDVIQELLNDQNRAPRMVVLPNRPNQPRPEVIAPAAMPKNAVVPVSNRLMPDGYRLVDRAGRLVREGDFYVFSFESRGQAQADAPIRLLPNRLLEDMEAASEGGARAMVFIVSGEVTEYHGVNYLMLQKLLTRPNLGNLK